MNSDFYIAVHALVYLKHVHDRVSSDELAENMCTNPVRVRKVMSSLKKAHLVLTREGVAGGYEITDDHDITLCEILDALHIELFRFVWPHDMNPNCLIASGMGDIMQGMYQDMEKQCRSYLSTIHIDDLVNILETGGSLHDRIN